MALAMAQNTLKQKARSFSQAHSVSYLTALKAVDEPLHELRDLLGRAQRETNTLQQHFRLIGDRGRFSAAFPMPDTDDYRLGEEEGSRRYHRELIRSRGLSQLTETEFFIELGKRTEMLLDSGAEDIWAHRELHRAGILDDSPTLEPIFHHYSVGLPKSFAPVIHSGASLGIIGVNMASQTQIADSYQLIPVTSDQLTALRSGIRLDSPVEFSLNYQPRNGERRLNWKQSYVAAYDYAPEWESEVRPPRFKLLLRSEVIDLDGELEARGLDPARLKKDDGFALGVELDHSLVQDMLMIGSLDHARMVATPGLLILG